MGFGETRELNMFEKGSTAVLSTPDFPFIVAVKGAGIYSFEEGDWFLQYSLTENIYKLMHVGKYIFGIGDYGTILRYEPYQKRWNHTSFPTTQRLWDITGNSTGLIVTHGGSNLFVSKDFGSSWSVIKPFQTLATKPLIRSLLYDHDRIYIGTQINKESGGLWQYSLQSEELLLVKKEEHSMISSIYKDCDGSLYITKGNALSGEGTIEKIERDTASWSTFQQPMAERAFLDLFMTDEKLYATTSKDKFGFSRIYEVFREGMTLLPIETVAGHGFRGAGFDNQLFISSPIESKWIGNTGEVRGH